MPRPIKTSHRLQEHRDLNIKEALRYHGLSIQINNEQEFNHIKKFLSEDIRAVRLISTRYLLILT
jgi:hypothetical protein